MKILFVLLAMLCGANASAARTAFQVRCEDSLAKSTVTLTTTSPVYSIDNSKSFHGLSTLQRTSRKHPFVLGLTVTEAHVLSRMSGPILQDKPTGYECVAPHIEVSVFYAPIVIYVAKEFAATTCSYKEILAHEMRHLNVYLEHLPKVDKLVRAALEKRFAGQPLYAPRGQSMDLLEAEFKNQWERYILGELDKGEIQQAAIDTPAEYERISKVCQGEVQLIIGPARAH